MSITPFSAPDVPAVIALPALTLDQEEERMLGVLLGRLFDQRPYLELRGLYYDGLQKMQDLGISIPPSLQNLRTVMGWPQLGIDAIDERCIIDGFRFPDETEADKNLWDIWQSNNLDGESSLAHLDALIYGRSYLIAGPGDEDTNEHPLITAESPINMTVIWDARMRRPSAAVQLYLDTDFSSDMYGQQVAALYLPDRTIHLARPAPGKDSPAQAGTSGWTITSRDQHDFGRVPVVRMANRQRLSNRDGLSEITPAWMNTTDSACRTLLGMEVGREFFAAPRRYILGATEEAFVNSDGSSKSAWDTYLNKIWGVEADGDGNTPTVGEFKTGDPKSYTELINSYTEIFAGLAAVPAEYLGKTNQGNPTSADAIRAQEARLVKRIKRKMVGFSEAWEDILRIALRLENDGQLPDGATRIETDWQDPATPTPGATSDAVTKQIDSGAVPPTSDVTLSKLGYSAVERRRMEADRAKDPAQQFIAEVGAETVAKAIKLLQGLEKGASAPVPDAPAVPKPSPALFPSGPPASQP